MTNSSQPTTLSELIQFIADFVENRFKQSHLSTNGALLAFAIKQRYPTFSYGQLGLFRLHDAVRKAEQEGLIRRNYGVKHLEIMPPHAPLVEANEAPQYRSRGYLRPKVWKALTYFQQWESNYFDKEAATLVSSSSAEYENNPRFAKIEPISADVQKGWMRQFLAMQGLLDAHAPIDSERWWMDFPEWLKSQRRTHLKAWFDYRSERILEYAREWAKRNSIPAESLFLPAAAPAPAVKQLPSTPNEVASEPTQLDSDATRKAILSAINEMTTSELVELPIPPRYLLRYFKAR